MEGIARSSVANREILAISKDRREQIIREPEQDRMIYHRVCQNVSTIATPDSGLLAEAVIREGFTPTPRGQQLLDSHIP